METVLTWIALVVGAAGAVLVVMLGHSDAQNARARGDWTAAIVTVVITAILFLVTLLSEPPFALGQRLGFGILIGGLLGAGAGIYSARVFGRSLWKSGVAAAGLPSIALLGTSLVLLIFPSYPQPALGGFIIGSLVAAVIFRLALAESSVMEVYALSSAVLSGTVLLSIFRFTDTALRFWWRAPLVILAAAIIAHIASAAFAREDKKLWMPAFAASVITLGLAGVFAWKVFPDWALFYVAAAGIGTFAIVAWLTAVNPISTSAASVATLAVVAFSVIGFRLLGGFGVGIGLIAAWSILLPSLAAIRRDEPELEETAPGPAKSVIYAMFIGAGVLFYRLYLEEYAGNLRGFDIRAHYTFVALALGTVFPFVLMSFFPINRKGIIWRSIGAAAAGFFAAVTPLVVLVLWGFRATLGFLAGTVAAEVFIFFIYTGVVRPREQGFVRSAILVLAAQVAALQFSGILEPVIELPRMTKVIILASVIVIGLIWAGISAYLSREAKED